jgi:hypothetical protein
MKKDRWCSPGVSLDRRRFLAKIGQGVGLTTLASVYADAQSAQTPQTPRNVRISPGAAVTPIDPMPTPSGTGVPVLKPSDFKYLGAMRIPESGYPSDDELTWSYGALAARRVNDVLQFFMTGSNVTGDRVFEFVDTQSYDADYRQAPRARMAAYWGDIYKGKRTSWQADGTPVKLQYLFTRGLLWHNNRLYWTYFDGYNVSNHDDWCIGMSNLGSTPGSSVAYGPWRPTAAGPGPGVKHAGWWLVEMPDGTLGAGSSLMSGNAMSSWGPELVAGCAFPTDITPSGFGKPNIVFPQTYVQYQMMFGHINLDGSLPSGQEILAVRRTDDYVFHNTNPSVGYPEGPTEIDPLKNGGMGTYTQADGVSSCVYINLPDKAGILFMGAEGTGHIWYGPYSNCGHGFANPCGGGQGPNASGYAQKWWIYDPNECRKVVDKKIQPWEVRPTSAFDPTTSIAPLKLGCQRLPGGAFFDRQTRRLYVAALQADDSISDVRMPLIHVFAIK